MRILFAGLCLLLCWPAHAYDKPDIGAEKTYTASFEDTLIQIARDHGLGFVELRAANPGVDPWIPGKGTKLTLPLRRLLPDAPREGIVINLPEMRLYFYPGNGQEPRHYPLGIGRDGLNTPTGTTHIVRRTERPTWYPTERMRREDPALPVAVPPGPDNPLGTHMLYLGWPSYGIHGTNKPYGIGRRVSSGCIRMYPEHVVDFYPHADIGTKVTVVNQPVKLAWIGDTLYMQAHPTLEQADRVEEYGMIQGYTFGDEDLKRILTKAGNAADRLDWPKIREALRNRHGLVIAVATRERS